MGKVRIVSGGEDGNYQVQRVYNDWSLQIRKNLLQAEIDRLTAENTDLDAKIAELQPKYNQAIEEYNTALVQFIADLRAAAEAGEDYPSNDYGYAEKYGEAQQLQWQILEAQRTKAINELALTKDQETLASLEALQDPPAEQAWCADFTEDATGELASIEVPGEPQKLLVYPQAKGEGAHNPARDGLLMPRLWATPEQAYWCAAVLPGWQRFKPTYRTGVITEIDYDADTCTVDIDGTFSSAQDLYINLNNSGGLPEYGNTPTDVILEGVPIEYMTCDAEAFEEGDKVVVQFDNQWYWDQGKVIGFADGPLGCPYTLTYTADTGLLLSPPDKTEQKVRQGEDGEPIEAYPSVDYPQVEFWKWSDEVTDNPRTDKDVQASIAAQAKAVSFPSSVTINITKMADSTVGFNGPGTTSEGGGVRTDTWVSDPCLGKYTDWLVLTHVYKIGSISISAGFTHDVTIDGSPITPAFDINGTLGSFGGVYLTSGYATLENGIYADWNSGVVAIYNADVSAQSGSWPCPKWTYNGTLCEGTVSYEVSSADEVVPSLAPATVTITHTLTGKTKTYSLSRPVSRFFEWVYVL